MSVDYIVTLGPVVSCLNNRLSSLEQRYGCCNKKCKHYHLYLNGNFCSECGQGGKNYDEIVITGINIYEVINELKDKLYSYSDQNADTHVYCPNTDTKDCPFYRHIDIKSQLDGGSFDAVSTVDITLSNIWLEETFAEEIKILRGIYGKDNVSVVFGLVSRIC